MSLSYTVMTHTGVMSLCAVMSCHYHTLSCHTCSYHVSVCTSVMSLTYQCHVTNMSCHNQTANSLTFSTSNGTVQILSFFSIFDHELNLKVDSGLLPTARQQTQHRQVELVTTATQQRQVELVTTATQQRQVELVTTATQQRQVELVTTATQQRQVELVTTATQ